MPVSRESEELQQTLTEARRMLASLRAQGPGDPGESADEQPARGTALDGMVRVTATRGGRIEQIEIDPRTKRLALAELSEAITAAANAALAEAAAHRSGVDAETATVDLAALSEQVQRIQDDGMRQMARITSTLNDAISRLGRRP